MLEDLEESAGLDVWVARMMAEGDPHRQLRIFVSWIRTLCEEGAPILRAAVAARHEPDVATMAERGDENRRTGTMRLTQMWSRKGALRQELDTNDSAERLWPLTSVEQYLLATDGFGWSPRPVRAMARRSPRPGAARTTRAIVVRPGAEVTVIEC